MPPKYLHHHEEFKELLSIAARDQHINEPSLVEKDYWIMHVLYALQKQGWVFQLKGGTSLSKGFGIINRFSEDIDIKIDPLSGRDVKTGKNQDNPSQVKSRESFFDWLAEEISIPDIENIERDRVFDDGKFRSAGIRLYYKSKFDPVIGLKPGILLEVGFDKTTPNTEVNISSWAYDKALEKINDVMDNRAFGVHCYNPEYTFVEKLQTISSKYRNFQETGKLSNNFLRHYYDVYKLIERPEIVAFIGTPEYLQHKKDRFKSLEMDLRKTDAFTLSSPEVFKKFEQEYLKTEIIYYNDFPKLSEILERIQKYLNRL